MDQIFIGIKWMMIIGSITGSLLLIIWYLSGEVSAYIENSKE